MKIHKTVFYSSWYEWLWSPIDWAENWIQLDILNDQIRMMDIRIGDWLLSMNVILAHKNRCHQRNVLSTANSFGGDDSNANKKKHIFSHIKMDQ